MKCEYCGRVSKPGETECAGCGAPIEEVRSEAQAQPINTSAQGNIGGVSSSIQQRVLEETLKLERENVTHKLYAGLIRRLVATWIDVMACSTVITIGVGILSESDSAMKFIFAFLGLYFLIGETYFNGATLGKKLMHIRVVNLEGNNISIFQGIIRCAMKGLFCVIWWIDLLAIVFSRRKQSLHDRVANTLVIYTGR